MPRKPAPRFSEKDLTKGELRKLNALRKSLGNEIAQKAFSEWYRTSGTQGGNGTDKNAALIAESLQPLVKSNRLRIPRGGYLVRRGRGRVIVERPAGLD
jgi:hypothetical protein